MKRLALLAVAAATLTAAPAARAVDVPLAFDNAVLDTPATPDAVVVDPSGPPIRATAAVDDTGAFTIDPATFDFPEFSFTSPTPGTIDVILNGPAAGQIEAATGRVTLNADFEAQVSTGFGDCNIDTGPLVLSTDNTEPLPGQRFPAGSGLAAGDGALAAAWQSLPPGTGSGCSLIDPFVGGPGGLWISRGITPVFASGAYDVARLGVAVKPARKKVSGGARAGFRVIVRNTGDETAEDVRLCARVPKPLRPRRVCANIGDVAAGAKARARFRVKTVARKRLRRYRIKLRASAAGTVAGRATAQLIVRPRR